MKANPLTPRAKTLITVKGYDKAFTTLLSDPRIPTQKAAYDQLEDEYIKHFGRRRYSNFASYRHARNYRLKRK
jgi:hypothetical protein